MVAVVITGPPGAGKSSVLTALSDALSDDDIAHATVEVEALVWAHPPLSNEQWTRHVRLACELYRDADYALLLVAQTLESDGDVAQLLAAIRPGDVFLLRLEARPHSLVGRTVAREAPGALGEARVPRVPASWSGLSALVDRGHELAASTPALAGVALVLATDDQ